MLQIPKIIQELRERILAAARRRLLTEGYAALSLRGIAQDCSIAVGTIYNYFPDKNTLIASVMLVDWLTALDKMDRGCAGARTISEGYLAIYAAIREFAQIYREVWTQFTRTGGSSGELDSRHLLLRDQLVARIAPLLERTGQTGCVDIAPILAETALSTAVQADILPEQVAAFIKRLVP